MTQFMSIEIDKIASALSKAQMMIKNVAKDRAAYNYKYADLASCLDAIKEPFSQNGLAISQLVTVDDSDSGKQILITLMMHDSGQWLKSVFNIRSVETKSVNDMQALGSGMSYARRYALSAIAGLAQEDDDAATASQSIPNSIASKGKVTHHPSSNGMANKLKQRCLDNKIDPQAFAEFYGITSKNMESVERAIKEFDLLLEDYTSAQAA